MGRAVPASLSVPALERDGLKLIYVCFMTVCRDDVSVPVQTPDRSGSAFCANHIIWKGYFQILNFNLRVTYLCFSRELTSH
jgi:hypothetical protein